MQLYGVRRGSSMAARSSFHDVERVSMCEARSAIRYVSLISILSYGSHESLISSSRHSSGKATDIAQSRINLPSGRLPGPDATLQGFLQQPVKGSSRETSTFLLAFVVLTRVNFPRIEILKGEPFRSMAIRQLQLSLGGCVRKYVPSRISRSPISRLNSDR